MTATGFSQAPAPAPEGPRQAEEFAEAPAQTRSFLLADSAAAARQDPQVVILGEPSGALARRPDEAGQPVRLGDDEWAIVRIARGQSLWTLNPKGTVQRLLQILFGIVVARSLANQRLEMLRRFAVIAWHRRALRRAELTALLDAGFSPDDAMRVVEHISAARGGRPRIKGWPQSREA